MPGEKINMTETYRKYRLTSSEEPTDDMLHALMEDVVVEAIKSSKRAEAVKAKMLADAAKSIAINRRKRNKIIHE